MAELYCDTRLGDIEQWIIGDPRNVLMRVADTIIECVAFLCVKDRGRVKYGGTGFFLSVKSECRDGFYGYFVTAKHCVERGQEYGGLYIRLNRKGGGVELIQAEDDEWTFSSVADVAVLPYVPDNRVFEYKILQSEGFIVTDEIAEEYAIGVGDELIIPGLFIYRHGHQRNAPIVRSGIIAAMPTEPLQDTRTGQEYRAYLAEVRSIGGLSGAPVFVFLDPGRVTKGTKAERPISPSRKVFLLGFVRGHWDLETRGGPMEFTAEEQTEVNTGIAIVTPIQEAMAILMGEEFVKARRRTDQEEQKLRAPKEDAEFPGSGITKEQFEKALKKASRKLPALPSRRSRKT